MSAHALIASVLCCAVAGCSSKTSAPATPSPTTNQEPAASAGLELTCEAPNVTFTITSAALTPSTAQGHGSDGRWSDLKGTYKLVAGDVHQEGEIVGHRDTDYAFVVAQAATASPDAVPVVKLTGGRPDGTGFALAWSTGADTQASAPATCKGSLLTAPPAMAK